MKRLGFETVAIAVAGTLAAWMFSRLAGVENMTTPGGQPFFGDYMAFWSAGRAALDGHAAEIHNRDMLWPLQQTIAPDVKFYAPWNSPPTFLLVVSALALLPYPVSAILFLLSTFAFFLWVIRLFLPDNRALIFPVTAPAVVYQFGTIQVGMLLAGISGLIFHWLDKRPRAAGALIALLVVKPHLALMWPLFLALSGRWRVFVAAAIGTAAFVLVAGLVFGFASYGRWFESLENAQRLITEQRITTPAYASLFANLRGLGVSVEIAFAVHSASALAGVGVACFLFRHTDVRISGPALCAATLLTSPYLFFYDFTLLLVGAALLGTPRTPLDYAAAIFAWGAGLTVAIGGHLALPVCPLAAWLVLGATFMRARSVDPALAPAPQP